MTKIYSIHTTTRKQPRSFKYLEQISLNVGDTLENTTTKKQIIVNIKHGNWRISESRGTTCYACCFTSECKSTIKLRQNRNLVCVSIFDDCKECNDPLFVSERKCKTRTIKNFHKKIHRIIENGFKRGCNIENISTQIKDRYPTHTITFADIKGIKEKFAKAYRKRTPNLKSPIDRLDFCQQHYISNAEDYALINKDTTKIITFAHENENCLSFVYSSPKLLETNLKATLKLSQIYLTIDGTYKATNTYSKTGNGNPPWVVIVLGTVTQRWDIQSKKWSHSFRPFLFSLAKSENKKSVGLLFETLYKVSSWFGYDKSLLEPKIVAFCSDEHKAFNIVVQYFPKAKVAHCWPHISRKIREGEYCSKRTTISDYLSLILEILRKSKTEAEFKNNHEKTRMIIQNNMANGNKYSKVIDHITKKSIFNVQLPDGMPVHTNSLERFFRQDLDTMKTRGALYLNENGGIYTLLKHAELKFTSDIIFYSAKHCNSSICHYERDMVVQALHLSNIDNIHEVMFDKKTTKSNKINFENIISNQMDSHEDNFELCNDDIVEQYPCNHRFINTRILVDNSSYFKPTNVDGPRILVDDFFTTQDACIGNVFAFIKRQSPIKKSILENYNTGTLIGLKPFVNWQTGEFVKDMFCFKILSGIDGKPFDSIGVYCIGIPALKDATLTSPYPHQYTCKLQLNSRDLMDCSVRELRCALSNTIRVTTKQDRHYLVNSTLFMNVPITNTRISKLNKSRNGTFDVDCSSLSALNEIEAAMSLNLVNYDSKLNSCSCDCLGYRNRGVCKHEMAVRNLLRLINLKNVLSDPDPTMLQTEGLPNKYYIKKKVKKWFDDFPITHTEGWYTGVVSGIRHEDEKGNEDDVLFKVNFENYFEFLKKQELDKILLDNE